MAFRGKSSFWLGRAKLERKKELVSKIDHGRGIGKIRAYKFENGSPPCLAKAAVSLEEDVTTSVEEQ
jgi:hypothetical protein